MRSFYIISLLLAAAYSGEIIGASFVPFAQNEHRAATITLNLHPDQAPDLVAVAAEEMTRQAQEMEKVAARYDATPRLNEAWQRKTRENIGVASRGRRSEGRHGFSGLFSRRM